MSKISELSDGGSLVSSDYLIAVRSGGNVKVRMDQINVDQVDLGDNEFIRLGNSQDLTMVHTSTQSIINQAGIGDLLIQKAGTTKASITSNGLEFPDNSKAIFGAGSDLQIYHNGSNSYIQDVGTGKLHITSDGTGVSIDKGVSELMATFDTDGAVTLYHNALAKLATTASGVHLGAGSVNATLSTESAGTSNLTLGVNAGNSITSGGSYNVVVGDDAGTAITSGDNNVAVGFEALKTLSNSSQNTAVGHTALKFNTAGNNSAFGYGALANNSTGTYNVAVGRSAGASVTTGTDNTLIGGLAGDALTTGFENVAVGYAALSADTLGSKSVAIGRNSLNAQNFTTATDALNVAVGQSAGKSVTTGTANTLIGGLAGDAQTTAANSTAVGYAALGANTTGANNTAIGKEALDANTTGSENVGVGVGALGGNTTAANNVAVGVNALLANTTGAVNVAVGTLALSANTTGDSNVALGDEAGISNITGFKNTYVGRQAGYYTTSSSNTLIGFGAGYLTTSGSKNTILGRYNGNQGGLDIRTLSNNIVLSDGDGNPRLLITSTGNITSNVGNVSSFSRQNAGFTARNGDAFNISRSSGTPLEINRIANDGPLVNFFQDDSNEGNISVSGSTVSYNGFAGRHESSGIPANTPKGTVVSTIDELDVYPVGSPKAGQPRLDHAKVQVSSSAGDACVYGVVDMFDDDEKVMVVSVGIGSVRVTGACSKGDLLESNGDGTAVVQSDDIIRSKTIGKVTIGNSNTAEKLVSCVLYCG